MYIQETTGKERLIIAGAVGDAFINLERAHRMLYRLWEDHFGASEQKAISADDAEDMADLIYVIDDIIFNSLLEYELVTGESNLPGVEPHLIGAKRAVNAQRAETLKMDISRIERRIKSRAKSDEVCDKRMALLNLSDEQAIPALEALLKEAEAAV